MASEWQSIETAPRDGRRLIMTNGTSIEICYPKQFPRRPINKDDDLEVSKLGDVWEYFRFEDSNPVHTWSMQPTHWMPLPDPPDFMPAGLEEYLKVQESGPSVLRS